MQPPATSGRAAERQAPAVANRAAVAAAPAQGAISPCRPPRQTTGAHARDLAAQVPGRRQPAEMIRADRGQAVAGLPPIPGLAAVPIHATRERVATVPVPIRELAEAGPIPARDSAVVPIRATREPVVAPVPATREPVVAVQILARGLAAVPIRVIREPVATVPVLIPGLAVVPIRVTREPAEADAVPIQDLATATTPATSGPVPAIAPVPAAIGRHHGQVPTAIIHAAMNTPSGARPSTGQTIAAMSAGCIT